MVSNRATIAVYYGNAMLTPVRTCLTLFEPLVHLHTSPFATHFFAMKLVIGLAVIASAMYVTADVQYYESMANGTRPLPFQRTPTAQPATTTTTNIAAQNAVSLPWSN
jgi:hypothetical protein